MKKNTALGNAYPQWGERKRGVITFNTQDINFTLNEKRLLKKWIISTIEKKKRIAGDISFIFCSDNYLLNINKQYLNHDTLTDIITFDYSNNDPKTPVSGDIFISIERVKENASTFSKSLNDELHRVIIHGVLHLLGYKDKTKIAKAEMTKQENLCLRAFQNN